MDMIDDRNMIERYSELSPQNKAIALGFIYGLNGSFSGNRDGENEKESQQKQTQTA